MLFHEKKLFKRLLFGLTLVPLVSLIPMLSSDVSAMQSNASGRVQESNDFFDDLAAECELEQQVYAKEKEIEYRFKYLIVRRNSLISQPQKLGGDLISQQIKNVEGSILKFENELRSMLPQDLQAEVDRFHPSPSLTGFHTKTWTYFQERRRRGESPTHILLQLAQEGNPRAQRLLHQLICSEKQELAQANHAAASAAPHAQLTHEQLKQLDPAIISIQTAEEAKASQERAEAERKEKEARIAQAKAQCQERQSQKAEAEARRLEKEQKRRVEEAKQKEEAAIKAAQDAKEAQKRAEAERKAEETRKAKRLEEEQKRKDKDTKQKEEAAIKAAKQAKAAQERVEAERKAKEANKADAESFSALIDNLSSILKPFVANCKRIFLSDTKYNLECSEEILSQIRHCYGLASCFANLGELPSALEHYIAAEYARSSIREEITFPEAISAKEAFESKLIPGKKSSGAKKQSVHTTEMEAVCALAALSFGDAIRCLIRHEEPDSKHKYIQAFLDTTIPRLEQESLRFLFAMVFDTIAALAYDHNSIVDCGNSLGCQRIACKLCPDIKVFKLHLGRILTEIMPEKASAHEGTQYFDDLYKDESSSEEDLPIRVEAMFRLGMLLDPNGPVSKIKKFTSQLNQNKELALGLINGAAKCGHELAIRYIKEMQIEQRCVASLFRSPVPHTQDMPESSRRQAEIEKELLRAASPAFVPAPSAAVQEHDSDSILNDSFISKYLATIAQGMQLAASGSPAAAAVKRADDEFILDQKSFAALLETPDLAQREQLILAACQAAKRLGEYKKLAEYLSKYLQKFTLEGEVTKVEIRKALEMLQQKKTAINDKKFDICLLVIKAKLGL